MEPRENDPSAGPATPGRSPDGVGHEDVPAKPPVRVEPPPAAEEEMGGEQPCQLQRWWDVDE